MAEPFNQVKRNYAASRGYMESLMSPLVDFDTGELKQKDNLEKRKKLAAILCTVVVNHVALINPDIIVFAGKVFDKKMIDDISRRRAYYLPAEVMPRITRDLSSVTAIEGLIQSCRGFITTGMNLIQSTGLPQQAGRMAI
jgi:hypothetical protein